MALGLASTRGYSDANQTVRTQARVQEVGRKLYLIPLGSPRERGEAWQKNKKRLQQGGGINQWSSGVVSGAV